MARNTVFCGAENECAERFFLVQSSQSVSKTMQNLDVYFFVFMTSRKNRRRLLSLVVEHSLRKRKVESSILLEGTILFAVFSRDFCWWKLIDAAPTSTVPSSFCHFFF